MAFFTVNGEQCRLMWPQRIGVVAPRPEDVPAWRELPVEYDALCEHVSVAGFGSYGRRAVFAHPELEGDAPVELALRLQGVVTDININTLGNWSGVPADAPKAMQWLALGGSTTSSAFKVQKDGMNNLEQVIRSVLNVPSSNAHPRDGTMKLQRRVFTKAREGIQRTPIKLGKYEDTNGRAAKMEEQWYVDHRIKTGTMDAGRFIPKHTLSIRRGDLVDVLATVEIVNIRGRNGRKTEIFFCPEEVVKLASARDLQMLSKQTGRGEQETVMNVPSGVHRPRFGFGVENAAGVAGVAMETTE